MANRYPPGIMKPRRMPRQLPPRKVGGTRRNTFPSLPAGRSLAEFHPLQPAERQLLLACRTGELAEVGNKLPEAQTPDNRVRAGFLRFLSLGGDAKAPIHEHGVQLQGACIVGELDLKGADIPRSLTLQQCHFESTPILRDARIQGTLNFFGARIPGLRGDRLSCTGSVLLHYGHFDGEVRLPGASIGGNLVCGNASFDGKNGAALLLDGARIASDINLDNDFSARGEVRLLGASIGGDLACSNASFDGKEGDALSMDRAQIAGHVFLNDSFCAQGAVRLLSTNIGGNLECSKASFDDKKDHALLLDGARIAGNVFLDDGFSATGKVRLLGASIKGNLNCSGASFDGRGKRALSADGLRIKGSFILRNLKTPLHHASFASAHVGQLIDAPESWGDDLVVNGFTYDAITGGAPTDALARLNWLKKQRKSHFGQPGDSNDFCPQPWQQLIKVLRAMGHLEDARQVAIAREEHLRQIGKIGETPAQWSKPKAWIYRNIVCGLHWTFGLLIAYGFRPLRMTLLMLLVWLACGGIFWFAAIEGVMAPSNPLVFNHPAYAHCRPDYEQPPFGAAKLGNWYLCQAVAGEYTTFSPLAYSLDLILPLVNLQQENDWAPIVPTPKAKWYEELGHLSPNHLARFVVWFEILFGWVGSLLLVAVISGLTQRDRE